MRLVLLLAACCLTFPLASAQDDLSTADPFEQLAYNAGFTAAEQYVAQFKSIFSYDAFERGLRDGLAGDSSRIAYALGLRSGLELRADTLSNVNVDLFLEGLREGLSGAPSRLTPEASERAFEVVQDSLMQRQRRARETTEIASLRDRAATDPTAAARLEAIDTNKAAADAFLAEVRQREGIQETDSGMLYTITEPGTGAKPRPESRVTIEYVGRFIDGEVFDQSPLGEPTTHAVQNFVAGFREAVLDMRIGESRTIYLPPSLAYGVLGAPGPNGDGGIPPNSALVFDITLKSFSVRTSAPPFPPTPGN